MNYGSLVTRIQRLVDDANGTIYSEDLIWDGVCEAHDAILPWVPKFASTILTAGSNGSLFQLPSDLYTIQAVKDVNSGKFLPRATLTPSSYRYTTSTGEANDWIEYPQGYLSLAAAMTEGDQLELYYFAYWSKPPTETSLTFVIEVPTAAQYGICLYAASNCLLAKSTSSANIRQYNVRVDSGTPVDNPLKDQSEFYRHLFYQEMKMMPPYVKVSQ